LEVLGVAGALVALAAVGAAEEEATAGVAELETAEEEGADLTMLLVIHI
jgi:hypothetical protein